MWENFSTVFWVLVWKDKIWWVERSFLFGGYKRYVREGSSGTTPVSKLFLLFWTPVVNFIGRFLSLLLSSTSEFWVFFFLPSIFQFSFIGRFLSLLVSLSELADQTGHNENENEIFTKTHDCHAYMLEINWSVRIVLIKCGILLAVVLVWPASSEKW